MRWLTLMSTRLVTSEGPCDIVARPGVRNMYGCLPCHRCGSGYRFPMHYDRISKRHNVICCDDCGRVQKAVFRNY